MALITLDLETLPDQSDGALQRARDGIEAPANYKKPEAIAKWIDDHADEAWRKTALDYRGEIAVICWAVDDGPVSQVQRNITGPIDEPTMLAAFWLSLLESLGPEAEKRKPIFCGWNVQFDLKMLWWACVKHGIRPPFAIPHDSAPWKGDYIDLMQIWDSRKFRKLKHVCAALGIEDTGDIDGSEVWDAIQAGRLEDVVTHCRADVERVREIYKRVNFL